MQFSRRSLLSDIVSAAVSAALLLVAIVVLAGSPGAGQTAQIILANGSFVALVSLGLTLVLRAGRLDLSVATVGALAGVLAARMGAGQVMLPGLAVAVIAGGAIGLVNGLLGGLSRMAAVVATIGTAAVAQWLASVTTTSPIPAAQGSSDPAQIATMALVLTIVAAVAVVLALMRRPGPLDALGGDAERSGQVSVVLVGAFVCCGALAALVGVLNVQWLGEAVPLPTTDLLPDAVAAALIGGSALRGGSGTGYGAVLASFAIATFLTALTLRAVAAPTVFGIAGLLVVLGLLFSEARSRMLPTS